MNLFTLFYIGFILGLTGAMAPGPLLTVTISESLKRGGIVGPQLSLGHSILEFFLLVLIVFGFTKWLNNDTVYGVIALLGGALLIRMGYLMIKAIPTYTLGGNLIDKRDGLHPLILGIIVTLSNPYWFIWWLTIGVGYVIFAKDMGFAGLAMFFLGHISSDFAWYSFVSYGIRFGGRVIKMPVLKGILLFCSIFLLFFGGSFLYKGFKLLFILP
ncbi:MAG: LysE family translocator [Deltaproteobacteria bacterium]|nr:LysE family translocator [Deltaproteobacteria bacterium]